MKNYLVYDLEIEKAIPDRNRPPEMGIEYCEGWNDHAHMGISTVCAYSSLSDRYRIYCADNFAAFKEELRLADVRVTFNGVKFDNAVLAANGILVPDRGHDYDILRLIWRSIGLDPDVFDWRTHGGYKLDQICEVTIGQNKIGHGAIAPIEWQQGRVGSVVNYCLDDVQLTHKLFEHIIAVGEVLCPNTGKPITLPRQVEDLASTL